jgi:HEAT repeat protein
MIATPLKGLKPDIGQMERERDIRGLIRLLAHPDFDIQWQAADALGRMGEEAYEPLRKAWYRTDTATKIGAIEAMGGIRDPRALLYLRGMIENDPQAEVRWGATIALGRIGQPEAIPILVRALDDPDKYVRYGAGIALKELRWEPGTPENEARLRIALQEWDKIGLIGRPAAGPLQSVLRDRDPKIRRQVVESLSEIGHLGGTTDCFPILSDGDPTVRWEAVRRFPLCGIPPMQLPMGTSRRPRTGPDPRVAAFLNLLFLGLGYNYLGRWGGFLLFQIFATTNLIAIGFTGSQLPLLIFPIISIPYSIPFAIHSYFAGRRMSDL